MKRRISIYQVLPRLFDNPNSTNQPHGTIATNGAGKLNAFTPNALQAIKELGCTHIWYTGVIEHATKSEIQGVKPDHPEIVKGEAGSPYAIKDYYDIAPELAVNVGRRLEEFDQLVERTHQAGLKVIIDFVPNHLARQYRSDAKPSYVRDFGADDDTSQSFLADNNFYYIPEELKIGTYQEKPARATGNDQFTSTPTAHDWYETVKLNYGKDYLSGGSEHFSPIPNTWLKMRDILEYWAARGVDGFRCDMAEMVPTAFWDWVITSLRKGYPEIIFIAEVYQPHLYASYLSAGFDYLYDKVGLYDTLIQILKGDKSPQEITHTWQQHEAFRGRMLHFMENHDEQRLASDFVAGDGARAFPAMAVSTLIDNAPIMTYFGQELGERGMNAEGFAGLDGRTSIFDYWSLRLMQQWIGVDRSCSGEELPPEAQTLRKKYQSLLKLSTTLPSIVEGGFYDLMYVNPRHAERGLYSFVRCSKDELAIIVVNFSDHRQHVELQLPIEMHIYFELNPQEIYLIKEEPTGLRTVSQLSTQYSYLIKVEAHDYKVHICHPISGKL